MATVYGIRCPKCGHQFEVMKGILMSECGEPVPEDRREDKPFRCPKCGKMFCVLDDDISDNVQYTMMAD